MKKEIKDINQKMKVIKVLTHLPESIKYLGTPDFEFLKENYGIEKIYHEEYILTCLDIIKDTPHNLFEIERKDGILPIQKKQCIKILNTLSYN